MMWNDSGNNQEPTYCNSLERQMETANLFSRSENFQEKQLSHGINKITSHRQGLSWLANKKRFPNKQALESSHDHIVQFTAKKNWCEKVFPSFTPCLLKLNVYSHKTLWSAENQTLHSLTSCKENSYDRSGQNQRKEKINRKVSSFNRFRYNRN